MVYVGIGVFLVLLVIAIFMNRESMYPRTWSYEKAYERELEREIISKEEFESYTFEEVSIESEYDYNLYGRFYDFGSEDTVIIVHGWSYNMLGGIKYMNIFKERGFNVMMYDHRNHGKSGGNRTTFGYKEKFDLIKIVDWVSSKKNGLIGTHGESMGGATVIMHAALDERIDFVIADCPFMDASKEFRFRVWEDYKFPGVLFLWLCSILNFFRGGGLFRNISPIKVVNDFKAPIMFIHGDADTYIKPEHSIKMFEERRYNKKLYLAKGGEHADAIQADVKEYYKQVNEFLNEYKIRES